jgi:hypothetical protein
MSSHGYGSNALQRPYDPAPLPGEPHGRYAEIHAPRVLAAIAEHNRLVATGCCWLCSDPLEGLRVVKFHGADIHVICWPMAEEAAILAEPDNYARGAAEYLRADGCELGGSG